jgi:hypothetical protein
MVEYGSGVSQGAGRVAGGSGANVPTDAVSQVGQVLSNAVHTVATLPPPELALLIVGVVVALLIFRRAF